jgi:uracil-DNA glycosylase
VDGKERLRRYLEQRRETGERELVLDAMTVDDVMRIVGARPGADLPGADLPGALGAPAGGATHATSDPRPARRPEPPIAEPPPTDASSGDWRAVLAAATDRAVAIPRVSEATPPVSPTQGPASAPPTSPPTSRAQTPSTSGVPFVGDASPAAGDGATWPAGIVVGQAATELFGGPLAAHQTLDDLARAIAACTSCPLYGTATNAVPGEGSPTAHLVCVGEAPGATEDATGRPFVGQAGKLLDKILAAIQLGRHDVFICNVLKHRPPGNRNPLPSEVAACSPYLVRQLELIRPRAILAFGTFAAQTLLQTPLTIGKLRGAVHRYYGVPLIVTYHPAALLRNPAWKRPTWEDVQYARRILDGTGL